MADEPEELLLEHEADGPEDEEQEGSETQQPEGDGEEEIDLSFGDESEAAPASGESEEGNSVIRGFRDRERQYQKRIRELETKEAPQSFPADPGEEPDWERDAERFEWDSSKWAAHYKEWQNRKLAYASHAQQQNELKRQIRENYEREKSALKLPQIDDAEKRVFEEAGELISNVLILAKAPALVAALDRHPEQLRKLSEIKDPAELLLTVGELKGKLRMTTRRKAPAPEQITSGSAPIAGRGADKEEARLTKEAERTGDRTNLIAYRKNLQTKAK